LRPYYSPISWFLDNPELGWTPPQTLVDWMAKARTDGKPVVYIGFGSITVPDPKLVTERIIRGVLKSKWCIPMTAFVLIPPSGGVRAIISKGWSARMSKGGNEDVVLPEECYSVRSRRLRFVLPILMFAVVGQSTTRVSSVAFIPT
jgi:sterol 3beta-glucosyltransferase